MENKGSKFFKKGIAFLIAPAIFSSFLPKIGASATSSASSSKTTAWERIISKIGSGTATFLENHWGKLLILFFAGVFFYFLLSSENNSKPPLSTESGGNNSSQSISEDKINVKPTFAEVYAKKKIFKCQDEYESLILKVLGGSDMKDLKDKYKFIRGREKVKIGQQTKIEGIEFEFCQKTKKSADFESKSNKVNIVNNVVSGDNSLYIKKVVGKFSNSEVETIAKISIDYKKNEISLFGKKVKFSEENLRNQLCCIKKIYKILDTIEKMPLDRKNSKDHKLIFSARKGNLQKNFVGENWQVLNCISLDFKRGTINIHLSPGGEIKSFSFSDPEENEECLAMLSAFKNCKKAVVKKKIFLNLEGSKNLKRKNLEETGNNNIDNILDESNN